MLREVVSPIEEQISGENTMASQQRKQMFENLIHRKN